MDWQITQSLDKVGQYVYYKIVPDTVIRLYHTLVSIDLANHW